MIMFMFWVVATVMVIAALFFLLRPLRADLNQQQAGSDQQQQNIQIAKERLNELKIEQEKGSMSEQEYEQTRQELELVLLNDIDAVATTNIKIDQSKQALYAKYTVRAALLVVPIISISLYLYLGNPDLINLTPGQTASNQTQGHEAGQSTAKLPSVDEMIEKLKERLKDEPENAEGWFMLARSYMSMGKYKEATDALEKTNQLVPNNSVILLRYADALSMRNNGKISGKPFELIMQALQINPNEPTGLWLAGMGYEEQGKYKKAISYWNQLLPLLENPQSRSEVKAMIKRTKVKAGMDIAESEATIPDFASSTVEKTVLKSISVNVQLDKKISANVNSEDTLFIFARAANGPPMPLAVVRKKVKDLPLSVILNDSMAMMPNMKLSSFDKVEIIARISKSGMATAQSGDLQSLAVSVTGSQKEAVELMINSVVP